MSAKPTTTTTNDWYAVDKEGLASLLERNGGTPRILMELVSNGWDAEGVTEVHVTLVPRSRGKAHLVVRDDSPNGFDNLTHAFTLFARSNKIDHAEKRGRFNLGEKLVLALCSEATIRSTSGAYKFSPAGREHLPNDRTTVGSVFEATVRMTKEQIGEAEDRFHTLIAPANVVTTFNGVALGTRTPVAKTQWKLRTEIADEHGELRPSVRVGKIDLYEPRIGETAAIYEMGIPVVEWDSKWHADVQQKVPLNFERDNVQPAYLRELRAATLNATFERLDAEDANQPWVRAVLGHDKIDDRAVEKIITDRFGADAVAYDLSDRQANQEAQLQGRMVVNGNSLSKDEWQAAKRVGVLQPAGKVTPSNSTVRLDPNGEDVTIDPDKWTTGQARVADYAAAVGKELLGHDVNVKIVRSRQAFLAAYGSREIMFNLQRLGHRWFDDPITVEVDALLIHEFAHDTQVNHLSEAFHDACCHLGAKLRYVNTVL